MTRKKRTEDEAVDSGGDASQQGGATLQDLSPRTRELVALALCGFGAYALNIRAYHWYRMGARGDDSARATNGEVI